VVLWYIFPILKCCCTKKNLATLQTDPISSDVGFRSGSYVCHTTLREDQGDRVARIFGDYFGQFFTKINLPKFSTVKVKSY
jgi:hypothetical protein